MKYVVYLCILLCSIYHATAQSADSVIQYKRIESVFTDKSKLTSDRRHYEYMPMHMLAGDVALIEYTSNDFVTVLMVRDSLGNEGVKEDDTTFFRAAGSKITLPFKAPADGPYYFVFMTKEPKKTGKYMVHIFHYHAHRNRVSANSSFCEKLKYISGSSYTGFEFLKGEEEDGNFSSVINLLPGSNQLIHDMSSAYTCSFPPSSDLAGLKKKFDELELNITKCLTDHKKKVYTAETIPVHEKKSFVRKVEFTLTGSYPKDLNATHHGGIKDKVTLELDKSRNGTYHLKLDIE